MVSPGRTGATQRHDSTPGEPTAAARSRPNAATVRRIMTAPVCQPLAVTPP